MLLLCAFRVYTSVFLIHSGPLSPIGASASSTITKGSPLLSNLAFTSASALSRAQSQAAWFARLHNVRFFLSTSPLCLPRPAASQMTFRDFILVRSSRADSGGDDAFGNKEPGPW